MSMTFSPRVVGQRRPDFHDLDSVLRSPPFAGKRGEELVLAIYNHFTSKLDGTYHFWPADERRATPMLRRSVCDPVKLLNSYGWTICGQASSMLFGLYTASGLPARQIGLPGHSLCEVFYEGRWHILDVDMWTWFRAPQGHIASAYELAKSPQALILENTDKSDPCDLPDRPLPAYAEMYAKTETVDDHVKTVCPCWSIRAHEMDFHLRPGETLIRSQDNQGRFHMPQEWLEYKKRFAGEWHGQPRERYEPLRTFGNGRWIYQPDLTDKTEDFQAGLWQPSKLKQDAAGLVGAGSAVLRIQSPYLFCGRPNWEGPKITSSDGVWLTLVGRGKLKLELSQPDGSWMIVFEGAGDFDRTVDVTEQLDGRYECLIRLTLGKGARLERFRFEGYILTAPLSIPRLAEGENPMELRWRDRRGLCTVPWSEVVDFRAAADMPKRWQKVVNAQLKPYADGWQTIAPAGGGPVSATWRFDAPAAGRFAWAYIHATLREGPPDQPRLPASLEWSTDGRRWRPLARADAPNSPLQWDGSLDGQVVFAQDSAAGLLTRRGKAVKRVLVRVTSGTAISGLEFHAHLEQPPADDPLAITHRWRQGQRQCEFTPPAGATRYTVVCGPAPAGHTVEMHAPSRRR